MSTSVYDKIIEKAKLDASKIIADGTEKVKELDLLTKEEVEFIQLIIRNLIDMYEEIKRSYPKYLKIEIL